MACHQKQEVREGSSFGLYPQGVIRLESENRGKPNGCMRPWGGQLLTLARIGEAAVHNQYEEGHPAPVFGYIYIG